MEESGLALVQIEALSAEDLSKLPELSKIECTGETSTRTNLIGRLSSIASMAPDVISTVGGKNLYKVVVPEGYSLSDLVVSRKKDGTWRAVVKDSKGHLNGDVSLKLNGVSPTQIASMGLSAMAMVVGQAYMTEISDSLYRIDSKLDTIISMMTAEKKAKVTNAIDIARSYVQLYDEYLSKPVEARLAARNEIESRYNDIGEVVDWLTEQLVDIEQRATHARATKKNLSSLFKELHCCEEQFILSLQALVTLAMTRMYYDGSLDERSALVERQRIERKTRMFQQEYQKTMGMFELKLGSLQCAPLALPQANGNKNVFKRLASETPRSAARKQLLEIKRAMQVELRESTQSLKNNSSNCISGIDRISAASHSAHTIYTDGADCWVAGIA